jgi:ribonuclease E
VARDDALIPPAFRLERLRAYGPAEPSVLPTPPLTQTPQIEEEEVEDEIEQGTEPAESERRDQEGEEERGRSRRRRRRRRRRDEEPVPAAAVRSAVVEEAAEATGELTPVDGRVGGEDSNGEEESEAEGRRRRRGRRGGRRRGRRESDFEPIFGEPRPPSDIVRILPASDIEELEPAPMAGLTSRAAEISGAEIGAVRESGPPVSDPVAAPGEMSGEMPGEITDLAAPPHHSVDARAGDEAADSAERKLYSTSETERTAEAGFSADAPPTEPEHPDGMGSEKSSPPRRGWWQRLIQP